MPNAAECHQIVPDGRGQGQRHGHDKKINIFVMILSKETDQASCVNTIARRLYLRKSSQVFQGGTYIKIRGHE